MHRPTSRDLPPGHPNSDWLPHPTPHNLSSAPLLISNSRPRTFRHIITRRIAKQENQHPRLSSQHTQHNPHTPTTQTTRAYKLHLIQYRSQLTQFTLRPLRDLAAIRLHQTNHTTQSISQYGTQEELPVLHGVDEDAVCTEDCATHCHEV